MTKLFEYAVIFIGLSASAGCLPLGNDFDSDAPLINCANAGRIECAQAAIYYVNVNADPDGDGLSWGTAFTRLQSGINHAYCAAQECGGSYHVWVAAGTYAVYKNTRNNTARLRSGVEVYGGFGGDETQLADRADPWSNETEIQGEGRVCHVVTGADDAVVDGFTITGGRAEDEYDAASPSDCCVGGGMMNYQVSPVVSNCVFTGNSATFGGGIYNDNSEAVFTDCRVEDNDATQDGAGMGNFGGAVTVTDTVFGENSAQNEGGGMGNSGGASPVIERCWFEDNDALHGGGMGNRYAFPIIRSSLFIVNSAQLGGGMGNEEGAAPEITNCTFFGNTSSGGGAIGNEDSDPVIYNSIFWGDSPDEISSDLSSDVFVGYSLVEGGDPLFADCEAIIDSDPLFVDEGFDVALQAGSPCIDAADGSLAPEVDYEGNTPVDDPATDNTGVGPPWADIGAYEFLP